MTFGLPLADVRGTSIGDKCPIKVDYPCQPGKYRAYNGYCNNVQNPNWGVSNRRYLRYIQSDYADGISVPRQRPDGQETFFTGTSDKFNPLLSRNQCKESFLELSTFHQQCFVQ